MNKVRFLKEPGFVYDLFYVFAMNFNKSFFVEQNSKYEDEEESMKAIGDLLEEYGPFSRELLPFFVMRQDKKNFMTSCYFLRYKALFGTTYNLQLVQRELADYDRVIENMLRFYFADISDEAVAQCKQSVRKISELISTSSHSSDIKCALYAFFIDPISAIQKLTYALMEKSFVLTRQYEKNAPLLLETQQQMDVEEVLTFLKDNQLQTVDTARYEEIGILICIHARYIVSAYFDDDFFDLLIGTRYRVPMQTVLNMLESMNLKDFGSAISEESRQEILESLLHCGEITVKDVEREFGFTGPNAYYHLALMVKARILKTRSKGRTVYYSINRSRFDELCEWFCRFATLKKEED